MLTTPKWETITLCNIRKTFLNQYGGIFWLNVDGWAEHPKGGSAYNQSELACIQIFLPRFIESLKRHEIGQASIGIVTPYREQEEQIGKWLRNEYNGESRVTVGTAHKFQGDEKDFIVFSTVISKGLREGSISWLQRTKNLLNVAVTRARVTLIVVGDWNYCQTLDEDHCFRHLADYVAQEPNRVITNLDEMPFFGNQHVDIIGVVTDPHKPEHNRTTLRRFIASCSEYIWWIDPFFGNHVFDLFWDVFQDNRVTVQEVRLLTAREQTEAQDGKKPPLNLDRYHKLRAELLTRGIHTELRLLEKNQLPHDRLLYTPGQAINMPPFGGAYGEHRHVSEYTQSKTKRELFTQYWEKALVPSVNEQSDSKGM